MKVIQSEQKKKHYTKNIFVFATELKENDKQDKFRVYFPTKEINKTYPKSNSLASKCRMPVVTPKTLHFRLISIIVSLNFINWFSTIFLILPRMKMASKGTTVIKTYCFNKNIYNVYRCTVCTRYIGRMCYAVFHMWGRLNVCVINYVDFALQSCSRSQFFLGCKVFDGRLIVGSCVRRRQ